MSSSFIFNQYYIDFLKRIKTVAKESRESNQDAVDILKSIKENYSTFDKKSDEYKNYIKSVISDDLWEQYVENMSIWLEDNENIELYKGVSIELIQDILKDKYLVSHFMSVFYIFQREMSEEMTESMVKLLQTQNNTDMINELQDEKIKKVLLDLQSMKNENIKEKAGVDMKFIEDTSIGKLAKEILEDVDVGKLQKSMGENGDILKAIGDPDSGFANIISNVSQKMASKISNGELKQDNLIEDAMKFASVMPGMFGGKSNGNGGNTGNAPDIGNIMSMMSTMMGSGNNNMDNLFKDMAKKQKSSKGTKTSYNEGALKKMAQAKKMKKKLMQQKHALENKQE
jgi:hypothetical protein